MIWQSGGNAALLWFALLFNPLESLKGVVGQRSAGMQSLPGLSAEGACPQTAISAMFLVFHRPIMKRLTSLGKLSILCENHWQPCRVFMYEALMGELCLRIALGGLTANYKIQTRAGAIRAVQYQISSL